MFHDAGHAPWRPNIVLSTKAMPPRLRALRLLHLGAGMRPITPISATKEYASILFVT